MCFYGEEQLSLVRWAKKCMKERKLDQLVDSKIKGTIFPKCLRQFAQIAHRCLLSVPKERPTMTEVMASLQTLLELQNKHDLSFDSPGIVGFTWKIHKYLAAAPKLNSDGSGTSSQRILENNMNQHEELVTRDVKMFTYDELKRATSGFADNIWFGGVDGYGKLYKGWVDKTTYCPCKRDAGLPLAVMKLHLYKQFDLEMLKEFRHPNIVQLIGYCLEGEQLFLVHEFMHNEDFASLLCSGAVAQLPLVTKVKIALGIARGIVFLNQTQFEVGESLLDRRKILLDEDFTAKLSEYDITKLVHGYYPEVFIDDYYHPSFQRFELRSGLCGFEVVFAEVMTGERISILTQQDRSFSDRGKDYLTQTAKICYEICNDVDSESKMIALLKEYDKLIRTRPKRWLTRYL